MRWRVNTRVLRHGQESKTRHSTHKQAAERGRESGRTPTSSVNASSEITGLQFAREYEMYSDSWEREKGAGAMDWCSGA